MQFVRRSEQVFFTRTGTVEINSREDAFFRNFTGKMQFHITGTLKFFEDNLIHFGAGIHQRGGDNGQAAAFFYVTRRTEKAFRTM